MEGVSLELHSQVLEDQVEEWMEGERTEGDDWKEVGGGWRTFLGQVETWFKRNNHESARRTPARTPSNNACVD